MAREHKVLITGSTEFYTVKEVAGILKLDVHTVYHMIRHEGLPAYNLIGKHATRIIKSDLFEFIDRKAV